MSGIEHPWKLTLSWVATIATIARRHRSPRRTSAAAITGYGFIIFTIGSIAWFGLGLVTGQPPLLWTNAALTFLNLFGVWRWLGRQAKVEDGSQKAARASQAHARRSPVSGLAADPPPRCVSAELNLAAASTRWPECTSGRIAYVMVSEGGIAGAGETLRRLPWSALHAEGDEILSHYDQARFREIEPVPKDQWPAH